MRSKFAISNAEKKNWQYFLFLDELRAFIILFIFYRTKKNYTNNDLHRRRYTAMHKLSIRKPSNVSPISWIIIVSAFPPLYNQLPQIDQHTLAQKGEIIVYSYGKIFAVINFK